MHCDSWSESQLRDFLVKQGIVAPSGPREQLVLSANKQYVSLSFVFTTWRSLGELSSSSCRYRAYTSALSSVSAAASTAVYGDKAYQATKTASSASSVATSAASSASSYVSSIVAESTAAAQLKFDDTKDYVSLSFPFPFFSQRRRKLRRK